VKLFNRERLWLPRVGPIVVINAHIDNSGPLRKADQARKLRDGDCGD
jgi:hypothetical protein